MPTTNTRHDNASASQLSSVQLEANRQNAKKSTGPRSAEGKQQSSRNATTHGVYARAYAIPRGVLAEDGDEVESFFEGLVEALGPRDALEQVVARRIASDDLRLARLERYESVSLGQVGRTQPGEVDVNSTEMVLCAADAAHRAAMCLLDPDAPTDDPDPWLSVAEAIWVLRNSPENERLRPDESGDDKDPNGGWRHIVMEVLVPKFWKTTAEAVGALEMHSARLAHQFRAVEGRTEERAVASAISRDGPLDRVSVLRARIQRERDRDRAAYEKLRERNFRSPECRGNATDGGCSA